MKRHALLTLGSLALVAFFSTGCIDDETSYPITGGGQIISDCDNVTVAFTAKPTGEWCHGLIAKGQLQLVDHGDGTIFHGVVNEADGVGQQKKLVWDDHHLSVVCTDYVVYGGCDGRIKLPDCNGFLPVKEFELTVSIVEGCADPIVCVKVWYKKGSQTRCKEWSGILVVGNITVHDKGELD